MAAMRVGKDEMKTLLEHSASVCSSEVQQFNFSTVARCQRFSGRFGRKVVKPGFT